MALPSLLSSSLSSSNQEYTQEPGPSAAPPPHPEQQLLPTLLDWFQGDFDNYRQVVHDRQQQRLPREGGGHEHIHCTLVPVTRDSRLAAFYFDGVPTAIFRFRYYRLELNAVAVVDAHVNATVAAPTTVNTVLYTLSPALEGKLRACSDDPLQWPAIFRHHVMEEQQQQPPPVYAEEGDDNDLSHRALASDCVRLLPQCDVRWSWEMDPVQHAYAAAQTQPGIHAVMVHGQAIVDSQMVPGQSILIQDQLSLWPDQLWIHDRGFDPNTGAFIYGNQRNVPYVLERVANVIGGTTDAAAADDRYNRTIADDDLAWTLGSAFRTPQEYESRLDAMGGPSRPARPPPNANS